MPLRSWICRLLSSRPTRRPISRRRLEVDVLEDRTVPAIVVPPKGPIVYAPNLFTDGISVGVVHTLRDAILAANTNPTTGAVTIKLNAGTYALTIQNIPGQENSGRTGDLDITSKAHTLIIQGNGTVGAGATIIDASALLDRVFQIVSPGTVVQFNNLIIKGGQAEDNGGIATISGAVGGGILNNGGTLTLNNVIIDSC